MKNAGYVRNAEKNEKNAKNPHSFFFVQTEMKKGGAARNKNQNKKRGRNPRKLDAQHKRAVASATRGNSGDASAAASSSAGDLQLLNRHPRAKS